ncbi:hypothetical protein F5Y16DRAFT_39997 [Xylariaceae sp. FL0255]|nr:hypothetical protein F5Y16DRAFT_39997 [Xylariaceae sp. FL0255]
MATPHPNRASQTFEGISISLGILTCLAIVSVALRFIQRMRAAGLWWDDWTILGALVFAIGVFINTVVATLPQYGASGYHITEYTIPQLDTWFKIALIGEVLYNFSTALSRISVLLFYRRIFSVDKSFLLFMSVMIFLISSTALAAVFGLIFQDYPAQAQWNVLLAHTSINSEAFYDTTATLNIIYDLAVFILIQRKVWELQLGTSRKALLSFLLLLGAFSIIASILRLAYLITLDFDDVTYSIANAWLWTVIEGVLYIICACLPGVYGLVKTEMETRRGHSDGSSGPSKSTIVTIGSEPKRHRKIRHDYDDYEGRDILHGTNYQVLCEPEAQSDAHQMRALDPVRVRRDFVVSSV